MNDRNTSSKRPRPPRRHGDDEDRLVWVWGAHAARAAVANKKRRVERILATRNAARDLGIDEARIEIVDPKAIDATIPPGAVHQGVAVRCTQPRAVPLSEIARKAEPGARLIVLDGVTDPHNVGAVMRSAVAFGAHAIVLQDRKAPPLSGACAKAAVGAADALDHVRVVNISRALEELRENGWLAVGLAGAGEAELSEIVAQSRERAVALVLGSEDKGLRPSVAAACDELVRIPISDQVESLNISTAGAIALYAFAL